MTKFYILATSGVEVEPKQKCPHCQDASKGTDITMVVCMVAPLVLNGKYPEWGNKWPWIIGRKLDGWQAWQEKSDI